MVLPGTRSASTLPAGTEPTQHRLGSSYPGLRLVVRRARRCASLSARRSLSPSSRRRVRGGWSLRDVHGPKLSSTAPPPGRYACLRRSDQSLRGATARTRNRRRETSGPSPRAACIRCRNFRPPTSHARTIAMVHVGTQGSIRERNGSAGSGVPLCSTSAVYDLRDVVVALHISHYALRIAHYTTRALGRERSLAKDTPRAHIHCRDATNGPRAPADLPPRSQRPRVFRAACGATADDRFLTHLYRKDTRVLAVEGSCTGYEVSCIIARRIRESAHGPTSAARRRRRWARRDDALRARPHSW